VRRSSAPPASADAEGQIAAARAAHRDRDGAQHERGRQRDAEAAGQAAARALAEGYDIEVIEAHHRHKVDAPSGTALAMGEVLAAALGRDARRLRGVGREGVTGERDPSTIGFSPPSAAATSSATTRCCSPAPASASRSRTRAPAAPTTRAGSLRAARFLAGRATGLYDMDDVLGLPEMQQAGRPEPFWGRSDAIGRAVAAAAAGDVGQRLGADPLEGLGAARAGDATSSACGARLLGAPAGLDEGRERLARSTAKQLLLPLLEAATPPRRRAARWRTGRARLAAHAAPARRAAPRPGAPAVRPGAAGVDRQHGALRRPVRHGLGHLPRAGGHLGGRQITIDKVSGPVGEALIMTAAGLAVAMPAVLAYNVFGKWVGACEAELEGFAHDLREMVLEPKARGRTDMAFGRLERSPASQPMSDINMTPLIDVMLVLLVIFIITAPLMTSSLKLDLPKTEAPRPATAPASWRWPSTPAGACSWATSPPTSPRADAAARARGGARDPATEVQLRADQRVPYGRVAELIGWCSRPGSRASASSPRRRRPGRAPPQVAAGTQREIAPS
jgi:biopolymer transport protein TolR